MPRTANPELVTRIVRVTAELIDSGGIEAVTVRRISEMAECSPTVIYHHFGSKDGLLHRAVEHGLEWFGRYVSTSVAGLVGLERVRATARAYVQWGISNQAMYRLMFEQRLPRPANEEEFAQRRSELVSTEEMLAEVFAEQAADFDPGIAARTFFASLHGTVSASISGRLWGPGLSQRELLEQSVPFADALMDQWIRAWGL